MRCVILCLFFLLPLYLCQPERQASPNIFDDTEDFEFYPGYLDQLGPPHALYNPVLSSHLDENVGEDLNTIIIEAERGGAINDERSADQSDKQTVPDDKKPRLEISRHLNEATDSSKDNIGPKKADVVTERPQTSSMAREPVAVPKLTRSEAAASRSGSDNPIRSEEPKIGPKIGESEAEGTSLDDSTLKSPGVESEAEGASLDDSTLKSPGVESEAEGTSLDDSTLKSPGVESEAEGTSLDDSTLKSPGVESEAEGTSLDDSNLKSPEVESPPIQPPPSRSTFTPTRLLKDRITAKKQIATPNQTSSDADTASPVPSDSIPAGGPVPASKPATLKTTSAGSMSSDSNPAKEPALSNLMRPREPVNAPKLAISGGNTAVASLDNSITASNAATARSLLSDSMPSEDSVTAPEPTTTNMTTESSMSNDSMHARGPVATTPEQIPSTSVNASSVSSDSISSTEPVVTSKPNTPNLATTSSAWHDSMPAKEPIAAQKIDTPDNNIAKSNISITPEESIAEQKPSPSNVKESPEHSSSNTTEESVSITKSATPDITATAMIWYIVFCVVSVLTVLAARHLKSPRVPLDRGESTTLEFKMKPTFSKPTNHPSVKQLQKQVGVLKVKNSQLKAKLKHLPTIRELRNLKAEFGDIESRLSEQKRLLQTIQAMRKVEQDNLALKEKIKMASYEQLRMVAIFVSLKNLPTLLDNIDFKTKSQTLVDGTLKMKVERKFLENHRWLLRDLRESYIQENAVLDGHIEETKAVRMALEKHLLELQGQYDHDGLIKQIDELKGKVADKQMETDRYYKDYLHNYHLCEEEEAMMNKQ